jgi:hypothetical protein
MNLNSLTTENAKGAFAAIEGLLVLLIVGVIVWPFCIPWTANEIPREVIGPKIEMDAAPETVTNHFSKWGGTRITSSEWEGTKLWQTRTNDETGVVEMRCVRVSAGGGYK